jgi:acetylornithine deacetylase/succinyl-diaminopimelate desuccinylase-like protein
VKFKDMGSYPPGRSDPDDPFVQLVVDAARDVYDREMLIVPITGGSGPNAAFIEQLGVPIATSGLGHPGGRIHAPNENIRRDLLEKAIRHTARVIVAFGETRGGKRE